jgi:hypothetical protein
MLCGRPHSRRLTRHYRNPCYAPRATLAVEVACPVVRDPGKTNKEREDFRPAIVVWVEPLIHYPIYSKSGRFSFDDHWLVLIRPPTPPTVSCLERNNSRVVLQS